MKRRLGVFKDFLKDYVRKKRKPGHYKTQTEDGCVESHQLLKPAETPTSLPGSFLYFEKGPWERGCCSAIKQQNLRVVETPTSNNKTKTLAKSTLFHAKTKSIGSSFCRNAPLNTKRIPRFKTLYLTRKQ